MKWHNILCHIECRFGDHVLLFSGSTAMMPVFQASCSQISCDFFSPHRPTHPKSRNLFDPKRTKRGLDVSLMVVFGLPPHIASAYFCILVFCFVLFFFVGKINWNCTKTLNIRFGGSRTRIKKWKTRWFIDRKGNGVGLGLVSALRFTRALSNGPDIQNENDCGQTIHVQTSSIF